MNRPCEQGRWRKLDLALASFLSVLIRHCHCHSASEPLTSGLQGCSWFSLLWSGSIVGVELLSTRRLNGGMRWLHQPKTRSKGLPLGSSGVPRKDVGLCAVPSCWGTLTFSLTPGSQTQLFLHVRKPEVCASEGSAEGPEGGGAGAGHHSHRRSHPRGTAVWPHQ